MTPTRDTLKIFVGRRPLGSVVKSRPGTVYAYDPTGTSVGTFADIDAAVSALTDRRAAA